MSNVENKNRKTILEELKKPFELQWRVSRVDNKNAPMTKANMVAYIDARDVQERLDKYCIYGWTNEYYEHKGNLFCRIGIRFSEGGEFEFRSDVGKPSNTDKEKGESSDAFKRAAVMWGVNRDAYKVGEIKIDAKLYNGKHYPCMPDGKFLKGKDAINKYCNEVSKRDVEDFEVEQEEVDYVKFATNILGDISLSIPDEDRIAIEEAIKEVKNVEYAFETLTSVYHRFSKR